jgi:hypothetical protein
MTTIHFDVFVVYKCIFFEKILYIQILFVCLLLGLFCVICVCFIFSYFFRFLLGGVGGWGGGWLDIPAIYPQPPRQNNNNKRKYSNNLVYRSFSINIYLYTTNTLWPILQPPSLAKKTKTKNNTKTRKPLKTNNDLVQRKFSSTILMCIYIKQILYIQYIYLLRNFCTPNYYYIFFYYYYFAWGVVGGLQD